MNEHTDTDLQSELAALRQRLGNLEAEHKELKRQATRARRPAFSRKFLLSALPVALLLAAGGVLYAVDALLIDKEGNATFIGNVGIRTKASEKALDVNGTLNVTKETTITGTLTTGGNVGIGTTSPTSKLTINEKIVDDNSFKYDDAPLTIFEPTNNGGKTPNGTRDILHLVRAGVSGVAYGNKISLALGRYEHKDASSRTQLDIKLTDGSFDSHNAIMSLRSNGNVGIGTTEPKAKLDVNGTLKVTEKIIAPGMITGAVSFRTDNTSHYYRQCESFGTGQCKWPQSGSIEGIDDIKKYPPCAEEQNQIPLYHAYINRFTDGQQYLRVWLCVSK